MQLSKWEPITNSCWHGEARVNSGASLVIGVEPFMEIRPNTSITQQKPFYFRSFSMTPSFLAPKHPSTFFFSPNTNVTFHVFFFRCYYQNTNFTPQLLSWVAVGSRYRGVLWCHISVCKRVITEGLTGPVMGAQWNVMLYQRPRAAQEGRCETGARRGASAVVIGALSV